MSTKGIISLTTSDFCDISENVKCAWEHSQKISQKWNLATEYAGKEDTIPNLQAFETCQVEWEEYPLD